MTEPFPDSGYTPRDKYVYAMIRNYGPVARRELRDKLAEWMHTTDTSTANHYLGESLNKLKKFDWIRQDDELLWRIVSHEDVCTETQD